VLVHKVHDLVIRCKAFSKGVSKGVPNAYRKAGARLARLRG
jgi:hypothetical protein